MRSAVQRPMSRHSRFPVEKAAAIALTAFANAKRRTRGAAKQSVARVRSRPVPFALIAVAVTAGIGLLAYGPSRRAMGKAIAHTGRGSINAFGRQLGRELRSFIR